MQKIKKHKRFDKELISLLNLNIKLTREAKELSQKDLDILTRLNTAKYESGNKEMTITTLSIYSKALERQPYELLMPVNATKLV